MDTTLSGLPVVSDKFTLSQLPFFSEDSVYDPLSPPHTSPSVCKACWKGPFARYLGLLSVSETGDQWYPPWSKKNSYSTSLTKLQSRADAGCVWCRFLLNEMRNWIYLGERLIITLRSVAAKWCNEESSWDHGAQALMVDINGVHGFYHDIISTTLDDPAASYIPVRGAILDVGSPYAMALARQRIDECVHVHERCKQTVSVSSNPRARLPTRLVDCADPTHPRLVSPTDEHGEYLALSYVWGGDQVHKTTRSNLGTYKQGIALSLLPATIRDAIRTTHMLGFRWLWVDSLCILQDSDEDKLHELGHMHHIYRYAHLTIIAASAKKVSEGFLHKRSLRRGQIALPFTCPPHPSSIERQDSPSVVWPQTGASTVYLGPVAAHSSYRDDLGLMHERAWCMQEYLMSPRSLIFTPATLHFRCLSGRQDVQGDSLCSGPMYNEPRIPHALFLPDPPIAEPGSQSWKDMHKAWWKVVSDYSGRMASVESDKLVACAAVAEQFHRVLCSDYLAGLWRSDALLIHLLWKAVPHGDPIPRRSLRRIRSTAYHAPSWSWAAIVGDVYQEFFTEYYPSETIALAKVVECQVTLEDAALPFGRVTCGTLVLSGTLIPYLHHDVLFPFNLPPCDTYQLGYQEPLLPLELTRPHEERGFGDLNNDEDQNDWILGPGQSDELEVSMDCWLDFQGEKRTLWVVPMVVMDSQYVYGIVLEPSPPANSPGSQHVRNRFRRVGMLKTSARQTLWISLTKAMQDGEWPLVDIEIV